MQFLIYFSTVFMFTTVTAFAFTGVKSIKDMLISYGSQLVNKLNAIDLERQKLIFSREFTASWIIGIQNKIEENGFNVESLLGRVESLKANLKDYNDNYKIHLEKELDKLYYKIKFYTFSFAVYSSLMILTAALDGALFFENSYIKYHLYSFLITIYLILSYFFFYKKYSTEVVKKYMKTFSIITLLYLFIILGFYSLSIVYFIVQISLLSIDKLKLNIKWIVINIVLISILTLTLCYFINLDEIIRTNFLINQYFGHEVNYKTLNYICIFIFILLYITISLVIPSILFRNKALKLRKNYEDERDKVWEEFKGLMFVKKLYKESEMEQERILKAFTNIKKL